MRDYMTSSRWWTKALRVVLVFALVFWCSFRVEVLAYAALVNDSAAGHEPGTLSDIDVWQVSADDTSRIVNFVRDARDTAAGAAQKTEPTLVADGQTTQFVALPAWGDSTTADATGEEVRVADFVEWSVDDASIASVQAQGGVATLTAHAPGVVTVKCRLASGASQLASASFSGAFEVSFTVRVNEPPHVTPPYVSSVEIHKPDGTVCFDNEELVLTDAERASYGLAVKVNVLDEAANETKSYDCVAGQRLSEVSGGAFDDLAWEVLSADGSAADASQATVENGTVKLTGDGPVIVRCTSQNGLNGIPVSAQVVVKSASAKPDSPTEPESLQGADHHQDTLTVTINAPKSKKDSESAEQDGAAGQDKAGQDDAAGQENAEASNGDAGLEGQALDDGTGASSSSEGVADSATPTSDSGEAPSGGSTAKDEAEGAVKSGTATYSLADLEAALDFGTETYTMRNGSDFTIVTGEGPSLAALLEFAGVPLAQQANIESIDFTCAGSGTSTVSVSWSDLVAANVFYPHASKGDLSEPTRSVTMLAARSYVHETGEDAGASISSSKLLDNTRFRLLYGASAAAGLSDPNALRWINGMVVNMKGSDTTEEPVVDPGDDPQVFVDYIPVPRGETAILSPRYYLPPSISGGSVQFGYTWETSSDGATWEPVRDPGKSEGDDSGIAASGQALHVLTDDSTIGTYRRFVLSISQYDGKTGEEIKSSITSSPVKIRAAGEKAEGETGEEDTDIIVALDYIPPIAGDVANFTAKTTVQDGINASAIDYEWQMSVDGGLNWTGRNDPDYPDLLKRQSGVMCTTLRVPTQPVSNDASKDAANGGEDGSGSDGNSSNVDLIYIRVVAHYAGHRPVASNAQPLTVHVGDSTAGGDKAGDIEDAMNGDGSSQQPSNPQPAAPEPVHQTVVTEIDSVVFEEPSVPTPTSQVNATQPETPQENAPTNAPVQVYINDAVSEVVVEQKSAQMQANAATPGYRWTQLSTVDPTSDDVNAILGVNPLAPFAAPLALGVTAAGIVEKVVVFRRQTQ